MPEALKERDLVPWQRSLPGDFAFAGFWKVAPPLVINRET